MAVFKKKINQYNNALKLSEQYIDQLLSEQADELNEFIHKVVANHLKLPSKMTNLKSPLTLPLTFPLYIYKFLPVIAMIASTATPSLPTSLQTIDHIHLFLYLYHLLR